VRDLRGRFLEAAVAEHAYSGAVAVSKAHGRAEATTADASGTKTLTGGNVAPTPEPASLASTPDEIAAERTRRWQELEDQEHAEAALAKLGRGRNRGGMQIRTEDFGL
jgi:hypothetical protein